MTVLALLLLMVSQAPLDDGDSESATTHDSQLTTHQTDHSRLTTHQDVSCGVGAAYLLLQRLGCSVTLEEVEAASPVRSDASMSFVELQKLFQDLGFEAEGLRMPLEKLDRPAIAFRPHPEGKVGHFVVVEPIQGSGVGVQGSEVRGRSGISGSQPSALSSQHSFGSPPSALSTQLFLLLDPLGPTLKVPFDRVAKGWDGRVLVVYPEGTKAPSRVVTALNSWPPLLAMAVCAGLIATAVLFFARQIREARLVRAMRGTPEYTSSSLLKSENREEEAYLTSRRGIRVASCAIALVVCVGVAVFWARTRPGSGNDLKSGDFSYDLYAPVRVDVPELGTTVLLLNGKNIDFGEVKLGDPLSHTIEIKNVGQQELPLAKFKMNCACNAQVEYDREVCPPGETAGIHISTKAVGYGPQRKPIPFAISHDGHLETIFTLDLRYRVAWLEQAQFVPSRVEFGEFSSATESVEREVDLVLIGPPDGAEPELSELESDSPAVRAEVVRREPVAANARTARTIPAQRVRYAIRLMVDPRQLPIGKLHGHVIAQTSTGEAKLHITGEFCRPIIASPASLLVEKSRTQTTRHIVRLRSPGQRAGGIVLSASATTLGVSCVMQPERNEIEVLVEPGAELSASAGVEIVAQAGETRETVRVPLVEF